MLVEMQSEYKMKAFWLDNNMKLISKAFKRFLKGHGIMRQMFILYRLQQNKVEELVNCTIMKITRSMLYIQNLYKLF